MNSSLVREGKNEYLDIRGLIHNLFGVDLDKSLAGRDHEYVVIIDEWEHLVYASDCALNWFHLSLLDLKGQNYREIKAQYLQNRHSILLETLVTGVNYEGKMEVFDLGSHKVYIECSTVILVDTKGHKVGALLYARDVTARVISTKQIQQYETMKTINNFASSMSHHLKNPLTAVTGFVQLIKDQVAPENTEQYCLWALEELQRIGDVLERISHLAESSEGQELIALPDLLQGVQRSLHTAAATMKVNLQMDEEPPAVIVKGHYEQLREAMLCLINNGMEAMPAGGQLGVRALYHQHLGMVEIKVIDQGTSGYNAESVFQPFYSSNVDRTGLGLNIAEHIAMVHRGYVRLVPNESGCGSTASLFLPAAVNIS
ncbi:MAG: histidine kinase dimerization/phospho-acceptor domain-containing protein [Methylocystaceae bacterium]